MANKFMLQLKNFFRNSEARRREKARRDMHSRYISYAFLTQPILLPPNIVTCRRPQGGPDRVGELMLLDGAGGFNLVHQTLPPATDKQACQAFYQTYHEKVLRLTREEEERLAFRKTDKNKLKKKKKHTQEITDFMP